MERAGTQGPEKLTLPANATTLLRSSIAEGAEQLNLSYVVRNFLIAPEKGLPVDLTIDLR
jgi:hypothetical protein